MKPEKKTPPLPISEDEWECLYSVFLAARDVVTDERPYDRERLAKYVSDYQRFVDAREAKTARILAELKGASL